MDRRRPARTGTDRRRPAQTGYFQYPRKFINNFCDLLAFHEHKIITHRAKKLRHQVQRKHVRPDDTFSKRGRCRQKGSHSQSYFYIS
jgi:hypothetical protein